jgi:hypothetical protein
MFSGIMHPFDDILNVTVALAALGFVVSYAYSQWKGGANKANADAVLAYKAELEAVKCTLDRMIEDNKLKDQKISQLQGQIDVLKEVPLVNIDITLKEISKFNKGLMEINTKILNRLESDAIVMENKHK